MLTTRGVSLALYCTTHALESDDSDTPGDRRHSGFGVSSTLGWKV